MEADWAVEVGPGLAEMMVPWEGFVDLRENSDELQRIVEAASHPVLIDALRTLNGERSPFLTSKCDTWAVLSEEIDADEFAAQQGSAQSGFACYIDVFYRQRGEFEHFARHEELVKRIACQLRDLAQVNCRVDLVVRAASIHGVDGYGITLYAAGCGADGTAAAASWELALNAAVLATMMAGLAATAGGTGTQAIQGE